MHVMTTRGSELCALAGPICDNDNCTDCAGWANLNSGHGVDVVTVADRADVTPADYQAAAADFLRTTGWATPGTPLPAELTAPTCDMAEEAADYAPGTQLRAAYNRDTDEWAITSE